MRTIKPLYGNHQMYCYDIANDTVLLVSDVPNTEGMPVFPALNMTTARKRADKIKADFDKFKVSYEQAQRELSEKLLSTDGVNSQNEAQRSE